MNHRLLMAVCLGLLLVPAAARAEDKPTEESADGVASSEKNTVELDKVVVTVDRSEKKAFEVRRSVDVLDEDDISRRQPKTIPDLLDDNPAVMVQRTNAGAGAPLVRGQVGPDNLILLDGIRISNSTFRTGPNQYLALIDPWSLSSLELLRGPGSVLYGSDALGGVFHAISRDPRSLKERAWGLDGRLSFASAYPGGGGSVQGDFRTGKDSGYLGGTYDYFGDVVAGGSVDQPLSDYQRAGVRHKSVVKLKPDLLLTAALFETSIRGAGRAERINLGRHRNYDNDDLLTYVRLDKLGTGLLHRVRVNLSYHMTNEVEAGVRCATTDGVVADRAGCLAEQMDQLTRKYEKNDTVHTPGLFATLESRFWDQRVRTIAGVEGYLDVVDSSHTEARAEDWVWKDQGRGNFSNDSTYASLGAFVRADADIIKIDEHVLSVDAGTRFSYFAAKAPDVPGLGDVDYSYAGVIGSAGLGYRYGRLLNLYADFSQGFRAPNLQETTVLGDTGSYFEVPNADLKPVRSDTVEVGMKLNTSIFNLNMAGWASQLSDVFGRDIVSNEELAELGVDVDSLGGQAGARRVNRDSAVYRGVDIGLGSVPFHGISVYTAASWIDGEIDVGESETLTPRRLPPLSGIAALRYVSKELGLYGEFNVRWAADQTKLHPDDLADYRICEDPNNPGQLIEDCQGTQGYVTLNFRAGYELTRNLSMDLRLDNISDARYRIHGSGIDAPGFNGMLELRGTY